MKTSAATEKIADAMKKLEQVFIPDQKVLGAFYCGSVGSGCYDQYSDIDLVLVVADEDQKTFFRKVPKILQHSVGLKSAVNEAGEDAEWCCLITDDYIGLDLPVLKASDLIPSHKFADIKILKDHRGLLRRFQRRCAAASCGIDSKKFLNDIQDIMDDQLYLARAVMKGRLVEAMSECTRVGEELFHWLVMVKGIKYQPPSLRDADKILTKKELSMLLKTRPKSPTRSDIRASAKALWTFTLCVIKEYQKATGKKFPPSYDRKEFLNLVNDIYEERRC